jgi:hypothetical protein
MKSAKIVIQVERGRWRTRDGLIAIVNKKSADGKWVGWIPGHFNRTWWHENGKHNFASDYDLFERIDY